MAVKISFVVPVYNMEKFLSQALDSLCKQSLKDMEIICVDDGSRDGSLSILRSYEKKDPRVFVFENKEESSGAAIPRNLGLRKATGEYVLVVDSDDDFHPELAEKVYKKALETKADIILFDAEKFHSDTGEKIPTNQFLNVSLLPEKKVFSPQEVADRLFLLGDGVVWNKLIRRSLIGENHLTFYPVHVVDDMNFTFSAVVLAKSIAVVPEKLLYYRVGNGASQMENLHRDPLTPVKVLSRLKAFLEEQNLFTLYEKTYVERGVGLLMFYFDGLKKPEDFRLLYENLAHMDLGLKETHLESLEKKAWLSQVSTLSCEGFLTEREKRTKTLVETGKNYGIYGFGVRAPLIYETILTHGGHCVAVSDSDEAKWGQVFHDLEVLSPEKLKQVEMDKIFISSPNYFQEIKKNLVGMGFLEEKLTFI